MDTPPSSSSSPPSLQPLVDTDLNPPNPTVGNHPRCDDETPEKPIYRNKKKVKKRPLKVAASAPSSSSSASTPSGFRGARVAGKRRSPKVVLGAPRRNPNVDEIAFRLGMSIAAFVAKILERSDEGGGMSSDHLAKICASAVRESLANDFGNTFDCFIRNFEESFGSTLRTLKSIRESSTSNRRCLSSHQKIKVPRIHVNHDEQDDCLRREGCTSSSDVEDSRSEAMSHTNATEGLLNYRDEVNRNMLTNSFNLELALHGQTNQLTCVSPRTSESGTNQSMLIMQDDLKRLELSLTMQKLKMKEEELALKYESNQLERSKFALGISKASFKAEQFKTQLEDTRHAELLRKCIDCLVSGLLVMAASLAYGAYVYSYKRLTEATASCTPPTKESKSWLSWDPMASFNSGLHVLMCKVQVVSRMIFGSLMIVIIAVLLLQRSGTAKQTMPVTCIGLLLGIVCGGAGKLCVDTLGGSGYHWAIYWVTLIILHLACNICTPMLYIILHGPIDVHQGTKGKTIFPYWIRRLVFYGILFLYLPLFCGLLPFASLSEWKRHCLLLVTEFGYW